MTSATVRMFPVVRFSASSTWCLPISSPAHPAAPTRSAETPSAEMALPRERAVASVSNANTAVSTQAPMLANGPHVDSVLSWPGRNDEDSGTVIGTVSASGTSRLRSPSVCFSDSSLSIGAMSTSHRSPEPGSF